MWRRRHGTAEAYGTVLAIEEHTIPNKARGKPSRIETRLQIDVSAVTDEQGRAVDMTSFPYRDFRYNGRLSQRFAVGDTVRITYASGTGRTIKTINAAKPR